MSRRHPIPRPSPPPAGRPARYLVMALLWVLVVLGASLLDRWLWQHCTVHNPKVLTSDYYQFARQAGYLPVWLALGAALWLIDKAPHRGMPLMLSAALGGAAAEIAKLLIQRLRPGATGEYLFGWSLRTLDTPGAATLLRTGYGTVSSHAGVAFGAAFVLMHLFPRAAPVPLALALACAATRLISGAHFASDIVAAAALSYAVSQLVIKLSASYPRKRKV